MRTLYQLAFLLIAIGFISPMPAFAYLDAGTGSMIVQLLIGGIAGLAVIIKLYWQKFLSIFSRNSADNDGNR